MQTCMMIFGEGLKLWLFALRRISPMIVCNCVVKVKKLSKTQLTATYLLDKHDNVALKPL